MAKAMHIPCRISKVLTSINDSKAFTISDIYDQVSWNSCKNDPDNLTLKLDDKFKKTSISWTLL